MERGWKREERIKTQKTGEGKRARKERGRRD